VDDADLVQHHLHHGRDAVGGATSGGHDVIHGGVVLVLQHQRRL
jgi:hypothetical protein